MNLGLFSRLLLLVFDYIRLHLFEILGCQVVFYLAFRHCLFLSNFTTLVYV